MVTAAARRFLKARVGPIITAAGWTWTPPGASTPTARFFHGKAPEGVDYPLVIAQELSPGVEYTTLNGNRIWSTPLWMLKAVTLGSSTDVIEPVVDDYDAALHQARGSIGGGLVVECIREEIRDLPELTDDQFYVSTITSYRMKIQEA